MLTKSTHNTQSQVRDGFCYTLKTKSYIKYLHRIMLCALLRSIFIYCFISVDIFMSIYTARVFYCCAKCAPHRLNEHRTNSLNLYNKNIEIEIFMNMKPRIEQSFPLSIYLSVSIYLVGFCFRAAAVVLTIRSLFIVRSVYLSIYIQMNLYFHLISFRLNQCSIRLNPLNIF